MQSVSYSPLTTNIDPYERETEQIELGTFSQINMRNSQALPSTIQRLGDAVKGGFVGGFVGGCTGFLSTAIAGAVNSPLSMPIWMTSSIGFGSGMVLGALVCYNSQHLATAFDRCYDLFSSDEENSQEADVEMQSLLANEELSLSEDMISRHLDPPPCYALSAEPPAYEDCLGTPPPSYESEE